MMPTEKIVFPEPPRKAATTKPGQPAWGLCDGTGINVGVPKV